MRSARAWLLVAFALAPVARAPGQARDPVVVVARRDSRVWLDGRTNVSGFSCTAGLVRGRLELTIRAGNAGAAAADPALPRDAALRAAEVVIPVRSFRCGNRRMEADLYRALKADSFPEIRYAFDRAVIGTDSSGEPIVTVNGTLTLAGAERAVTVLARVARTADGIGTARGHVTIQMTRFGVVPPTAFLGLIRVKDWIVARFDVRVTLPTEAELAERELIVVIRGEGG